MYLFHGFTDFKVVQSVNRTCQRGDCESVLSSSLFDST